MEGHAQARKELPSHATPPLLAQPTVTSSFVLDELFGVLSSNPPTSQPYQVAAERELERLTVYPSLTAGEYDYDLPELHPYQVKGNKLSKE
jgi:hypothetical protein